MFKWNRNNDDTQINIQIHDIPVQVPYTIIVCVYYVYYHLSIVHTVEHTFMLHVLPVQYMWWCTGLQTTGTVDTLHTLFTFVVFINDLLIM